MDSMRLPRLMVLAVLLCVSVPEQANGQVFPGPPQLISINVDGTATANAESEFGRSDLPPRLTPDGRFLVFDSNASDLVVAPADGNGTRRDVFRHDFQTGINTLVNVNAGGTASGNFGAFLPVISADGRFVAFDGFATDLVPGLTDDNNTRDVFVRDLVNETTEFVSLNNAGTGVGVVQSESPQMSADGRFVYFFNRDSVDISGITDANGRGIDLFRRDRLNDITQLVNINTAGTASTQIPFGSGVGFSSSADGRYVAFGGSFEDLVTNDSNGRFDVFVRDMDQGITTLASVNLVGTSPPGLSSQGPIISANGRVVAFRSEAANLVATPKVNGFDDDVFVRDLDAEATTLVSINSIGTATGDGNSTPDAITPDGRFVLFTSRSTDIIPGSNPSALGALYRRDVVNGTTTLVSVNSAGTETVNGLVLDKAITPDGRFVAFETLATDIVPGLTDNNGNEDIFLRDLELGVTRALSLNSAGTATANGESEDPIISDDGTRVIFESDATDLVDLPDTNNRNDVFAVSIDQCIDRADVAALVGRVRSGAFKLGFDDINGDGAVNIADARALALQCTNRNCVPCN